ncbi:uncharacterized protein LOC126050697 [Accipiter gentilis]|uniref:uncharacterized protein LOC126050697 n=1 Tax=Astur gentilis TaxID=8957 RepID=UPI00210FF2BD|nr:uncharacterized protein LOC126050697 [Accipiter gentilis]
MVLCPGRHPFDHHEDGSPQHQPAGQLGPCCGGCRASGTLVHEGQLWGAWPSPACCWDPQDGCALPYPCHPRWPSGPGVPACSVDSLTSTVFSVAISSAGTASPPAPCCPGAEGPVEETLSAMLASCRLSAEAAIDRRSFITSGLASQLLEELLSQQLPGTEPGPAEGSEKQCRTAVASSSSLERLRRHDRRFQRAKEHFQKQGWVPATNADQDTAVIPCHLQPEESQGQVRWGQGSAAQPCREARGHLFCGTAWHAAHGCCARVETVNSACPWDGDPGTVSHTSHKPRSERGHGRGPAGQPPLSYPGTWAPVWREPQQCPEKHWGSPRDTPASRPAHGTASIPRDSQPSCTGTACAMLSPEPQHCWGAASSMPRAGREPRREPEPTQQPRAQQLQGPTRMLRYRDGEPAHGCGSVPGCPPGPRSRGGSRKELRSQERVGQRDATQSHHGRHEQEEMLVPESWSRGQKQGREPSTPSRQRQENSRQRPPIPDREESLEWDPSTCPGTTNMVRFIARSFELRAQQDAAQAERERQAWHCRGARTADSPPGCSGGDPRAQSWLVAEAAECGTAGAQAVAQPYQGGKAGGRDGEEGRQHGGHSQAPWC